MIIAFYKPYGVLSQFSPSSTNSTQPERTLQEFGFPKGVYPAGRLDKDSEGLLILTDEKDLLAQLTHPQFEKTKSYLVQVEGLVESENLKKLSQGVVIKGNYKTQKCFVEKINGMDQFPPRDPPIRFRKNIPTSWIRIILTEGKNRQVRSMTAAIGHPTLRLIRDKVSNFCLFSHQLSIGSWQVINKQDIIG
jgi:23S rRNA pseudouridine2457 synthase